MPYQTVIDCETVHDHLGRPDWVVVDCRFDLADTGRGERDYAASHLPSAHYAHLDRVLSAPVSATTGRHPLPDPEQLARWLRSTGVAAGTQVVVYDDSAGSMAVRLWWLLRWLGHAAAAVLDGGWQAWLHAGYPVTERGPETLGGAFQPRVQHGLVLTAEQIMATLGTRRWLLLDARTPERYRGEQEPIDRIAGHIPGAVNHPLQENLDATGRFLPADELRRRYRAVIGARDPRSVACFCGSGVSACHNLLAMEIAGLAGARLYPGSWSEWIADPRRPLATGGVP